MELAEAGLSLFFSSRRRHTRCLSDWSSDVCSSDLSVSQLRDDMPKTWKEAWPGGAGPYVLGGVLGGPLGIWLLNHMPAAKLMLVFGAVLTIYSVYSLLKPSGLKMKGQTGASSGIAVGFVGGTVGGFTAFPGAAVVVWTGVGDRATVHSRLASDVAGDNCLRISLYLCKTFLDSSGNHHANCSSRDDRRCLSLPAYLRCELQPNFVNPLRIVRSWASCESPTEVMV